MFGIEAAIAAGATIGALQAGAMTRTDVLYGWAGLQNSYIPPKVFPRSDETRINRMNRYVEWKREKIWERNCRVAAFGVALLVIVPAFLAVVSLTWQWAIAMALG